MKKYNFLIIYLTYSYLLNGISSEKSVFVTNDKISSLSLLSNRQNRLQKSLIELKKIHVESNIINRYAHTVISARYYNPTDTSQDAVFSVFLQDTAFITKLRMEVDDIEFSSIIQEKTETEDKFGYAKNSSAIVSIQPEESNRFDVSVNLQPNSNVTFYLSYEELLIRKLGKYDMVINLHPGQLVEDFTVDVYISESRPLLFVRVPELRFDEFITKNENTKATAFVNITNIDIKKYHIHFGPNIEQQKIMAKILSGNCGVKGEGCWKENIIAGQFIIEYDVIRDPTGGEVLISNDGYFIHYFSPPHLKPIPKHVIFVLDVSRQMFHLDKVKEAMKFFLDELSPEDYFNIIEFSDVALVWNIKNKTESPSFFSFDSPPCNLDNRTNQLPPPFPATEDNIEDAKRIVREMKKGYGTNCYDAFITALKVANSGIPQKKLPEPIIIFLSSNNSTVGETNPKKIIQKFNRINKKNKVPLFLISFDRYNAYGDMALQNNGFVRNVYSGSDITLQLQDFYKTISSKLLSNVKFNISAIDVTQNEFPAFFDGSEILVAGRLPNMDMKPDLFKVQGVSKNGPSELIPDVTRYKPERTDMGQLEKLWAYLTTKQLLQRKPINKKLIIDLSLKYGFVTPYTSIIVENQFYDYEDYVEGIYNYITPKSYKKRIEERYLPRNKNCFPIYKDPDNVECVHSNRICYPTNSPLRDTINHLKIIPRSHIDTFSENTNTEEYKVEHMDDVKNVEEIWKNNSSYFRGVPRNEITQYGNFYNSVQVFTVTSEIRLYSTSENYTQTTVKAEEKHCQVNELGVLRNCQINLIKPIISTNIYPQFITERILIPRVNNTNNFQFTLSENLSFT